MKSSVLIHMVDLDEKYGKLVKDYLAKHDFKKVSIFTDEKECLSNMKMRPDILITGYHLKNMSGLQLIKKTKSMLPSCYSILLSGDFHNDTNHAFDERFLQLVDKYIIKGMDDMEELMEALVSNLDN